ncbi:S-layer homology domain-containing protein [uncultured Mitsuokella sp.]|uniref:S-layer homology domain-containing protein n=1 Tax=uncultured Mitsuokella sp. TaxID=453120 RepID=UPI002614FBB5|nr:S-layer homology domain-containing protein [uncultured Mitsuokella sp.]
MKKTLVSALTTALVVGAASTTFAATNPFSDVPSDHWAYDAVSQLAADGVIEGYGDTTFRGNQNITRYEMAQMIAKAMAKSDVSAADKALIDKLAAEFADELNNLGVRVSNLERNADKVKWNGEARYTYTSTRDKSKTDSKSNDDELLLRLEPSAEVNDHWHVNARLDASTDLAEDKGDDNHGGSQDTNVKLQRIWAEGQYGTTNIKLGKLPMQIDDNLLFDDEISGAAITTGKDLKVTLQAGRFDLNGDTNNEAVQKADDEANDAANMQSIGLQYGKDKLSLGAAYHHLNSDAFTKMGTSYKSTQDEDNADIWSANLHYAFDKNVALGGVYAENTKADDYKKAGTVELDYKGAQQENKGTWGAYAAYRYLGRNVAFDPSYDGAWAGTKGWEVGTDYTLFKNTVASLKYFNGEKLDSGKDAEKLFGRVEFFF